MKSKDLVSAVIEIEDVEYLINKSAAKLIENGEETIVLIRLFDKTPGVFSLLDIKKSISRGIVDRLG